MQIESKGFIVTYYGDASVGINNAEWQITGQFFFNDKPELEEFKQKLIEAFEVCNDTPIGVESFEERAEAIKKENELYGT